ncbi:MAG: hypothetical protein JW779_06820 [Candidatus Thorarchaeota archaeon]|nr:hypothetical protein [Candidatus Thorarchaeota archaeon]
MPRIRWSGAFPIYVLGLAILLFYILLASTSSYDILQLALVLLTPMIAFTLGIMGLRIYARESGLRNDRFHTLNLWIAIGLIMLSLSEIAGILVFLAENTFQLEIAFALVQMPGIFLLGFGIMQYLRSVNSALEIMNGERMWIILVLIVSLTTLGVLVIIITQFPNLGVIRAIVISPIISSLILFCMVALGFIWTFQNGEIVKPLLLVFLGFLIYLVRSFFWVFSSYALATPTDSLLAIESYVFFGSVLLLSQSMDKYQ